MKNDCYLSRFSKLFIVPLCYVIKPLFRSFFKVKAYGLENIPEGSYLVAPNHRSYLDPPVLNAVFPKHLTFIAKEELFHAPILGILLPHMSTIPIKRGAGDVQTLKLALELLHAGCRLCVFPEGTRAKPGEFLKPKLGIGLLAVKSKKPVLPVYIDGTDKVLPRGKKIPSIGHTIRVFIGKPRRYDFLEDDPKSYKAASNMIMEEIKKLSKQSTGLPPL